MDVVSVPSSSGHRPDGIDAHSGHALGLSPFFIRASAGPDRTLARQGWSCLSPFFIRASAGRPSARTLARRHRSQSLLHQGIGRTHAPTSWPQQCNASQSLLHQGIGRTLCIADKEYCTGLSPFFIRASAGRGQTPAIGSGLVSVPSSSGHRPDLDCDTHGKSFAVSVPSSSGHRPDISRSVVAMMPFGLSPFFIRASAGRTIVPLSRSHWRSQSLLHQGIGRTEHRSMTRTGNLVSVPSSSGHRPDLRSTVHTAHIGLSPFFIRASAGPIAAASEDPRSVSVPSSSGHRPDM